MAGLREVKQGIQVQGKSEEVPYAIDFADWDYTPTSPVVKAYDADNLTTEVTSTLFPTNNPTIVGTKIVLSLCKAGTVNKTYKIVVSYTYNTTAKLSTYFFVRFEND